MLKFFLLIFLALAASGCSYIDWNGVWLGCPKGQLKKPAVIGMFGTVKAPSECKSVQWMKDYNYVEICKDHPGKLCEKYHMQRVVGDDVL